MEPAIQHHYLNAMGITVWQQRSQSVDENLLPMGRLFSSLDCKRLLVSSLPNNDQELMILDKMIAAMGFIKCDTLSHPSADILIQLGEVKFNIDAKKIIQTHSLRDMIANPALKKSCWAAIKSYK